MKLLVFSTRQAAEAAQRALDQAAGLPRSHDEGRSPDDYKIADPGEMAETIRAHGVRTEHAYSLVVSDDGQRFGVAAPDELGAVEIDEREWWAPGVARP